MDTERASVQQSVLETCQNVCVCSDRRVQAPNCALTLQYSVSTGTSVGPVCIGGRKEQLSSKLVSVRKKS